MQNCYSSRKFERDRSPTPSWKKKAHRHNSSDIHVPTQCVYISIHRHFDAYIYMHICVYQYIHVYLYTHIIDTATTQRQKPQDCLLKPLGVPRKMASCAGSWTWSRPWSRFRVQATTDNRDPTDHINLGILQTMSSGIPLMFGLGTRMSDPHVYVVFWAPRQTWRAGVLMGEPLKGVRVRFQGSLRFALGWFKTGQELA